MEAVRVAISAEYSEFKAFLNDLFFRNYRRRFIHISETNEIDESFRLEYHYLGVMFYYKIMFIKDGLDISITYWAEVIHDEEREGVQKHIDFVIQEIRNKFRSANFPLGFKNLILDNEHSKMMEDLWVESEKTQTAKAYLSTIVILGSILEGLLLYKIKKTKENLEKARRSDSSPKETVKGEKKVLPISKWKLRDMIQVSRECGWINEYSYNYSETLRMHRNFVHPFQQLDEMFSMPDENACKISRIAFESIFNDLLKNENKESYSVNET